MLTRLDIQHVRNITDARLSNFATVNVFYGLNGSGKTTVLESLHMLAMARSFRRGSVGSLISHGENSSTVFGTLLRGSGESRSSVSIGVQRHLDGEVQIKIAGEVVRKTADLVQILPVQVISAQSFDLLCGAPSARRQYLDWGVFHVEHGFYAAWQHFQRYLKQRNQLLRRDKIDQNELKVWTQKLAEYGDVVGAYRERYISALVPYFRTALNRLLPEMASELELRYSKGWDNKSEFIAALHQAATGDRQQGYTRIGPQRADVRVQARGRLASEVLSRGQQKLVVCALKLAQGQLLADSTPTVSFLYLVDDLPAELDREHCTYVCQMLATLQAQVFITCVEGSDVIDIWPDKDNLAMFHVEHGIVRKQQTGLASKAPTA